MKISYNQLKEFIHLEESPEEVAELLTSIGLEVEGIEKSESVPGGMKGLVVGEVMEIWKHPGADKLNCTKVDIGTGELLPIVCGASNVAKGQKVIVATVGTQLHPTTGDSFEIKKAKIRGEVSEGMICAEDEIGVGNSHDGIIVLPTNTAIGTSAADIYNISDDHVFEIGLTPNRADAASHYGVARDLRAVISRRKGRNSALCKPSVDDFTPQPPLLNIPVKVENHDACPRYVGVTISDVEVQPSPDWLQHFLVSIGLRPINNIVDITNFINHAYGQPLHAFDADKITGNTVVVKTMPAGTKFTTLDNTERTLASEDLMICNQAEPMCIAGVFGGAASGVTSSTRNIFLESAYFNPVWVRKTAKRHGLNTDASFRFERGIDPNITIYAAKLAAILIAKYGNGRISSDVSDTHPQVFLPFQVSFRPERASAIIGLTIPEKQMEQILNDLEIEVKTKENGTWHLHVPPYKVDVTREADVIEEILRIFGYDEVPVSKKVLSTIQNMKPSDIRIAKDAVTQMLVANGFLECMSNSMTDEKFASLSASWTPYDIAYISNPLSSELGIMRPALVFSALQSAAYNLNRQQTNLKLFEFGNVYHAQPQGFKEDERLAILVAGEAIGNHWRVASVNADWFELKGAIEMIFQRLGVETKKLEVVETTTDWFTYGLEWRIKDQVIATAGAISENLKKSFEVKRDVFYMEIHWKSLVSLRKKHITVGPLPKYPEVQRDLALLVESSVSYSSLERLAFQTEKKLLKKVVLFDVYQGKGIPDGTKSYALRFGLRNDEKTLTDHEVDAVMNKLLEKFKSELGASLR